VSPKHVQFVFSDLEDGPQGFSPVHSKKPSKPKRDGDDEDDEEEEEKKRQPSKFFHILLNLFLFFIVSTHAVFPQDTPEADIQEEGSQEEEHRPKKIPRVSPPVTGTSFSPHSFIPSC
jgi:hypothetical protein